MVIVRCVRRPLPRLDAAYATFPLINQYSSIRDYFVGYPPILVSIGLRKAVRNPLTMIVVPAILSCPLGGINGGFVSWLKLSNLLKS